MSIAAILGYIALANRNDLQETTGCRREFVTVFPC
jgi:hypothetical protein